MIDGIALEALTGGRMKDALPDLARLRIAVFRSFPYLYEGDADYEVRYLSTLAEAEGSTTIVARAMDRDRDGDRIIGAATGLPLALETDNVVGPLRQAGYPIDTMFYFGESVLDPAYRGRGIGVRFFEAREAHARSLGLRHCVFCGVVRPDDHPARPAKYTPLDQFWRNRGYRPLDGLTCQMDWCDVGDPEETTKTLAFWGRDCGQST